MSEALLRYVRRRTRGGEPPLIALRRWIERRGTPDAAGVRALAEQTGLPEAAVRGAISFYDELHAVPGTVRVCHGTSCWLAGAQELARAAGSHGPWSPVYCLGYCDRSPAVLDRRRQVVAPASPAQAAALAAGALAPAAPLPAVRSLARTPILTARLGGEAARSLAQARAEGAWQGLVRALGQRPAEVLALLERSGLRGRGGAAFPAAAKWRHAAQTGAPIRYVIANGDEGDPGSFCDRVLMEGDPHAVLEGMAICAYAVGARQGIVFIRSEYPRAIAVMEQAVDQARAAGLLGERVLGTAFDFEVSVFPGMGSYVCGEETALLNAIEGLRGEVRLRPPYPSTAGLYGRPTVVNNVETLAAVPWILRHGPEAFRALGTAASPGTKLLSLNGGFARPGLLEVEFGVSLREIIERGGGGARPGSELAAILLGGPMGSVLGPEHWDVPLCYEAMAGRGIQLGHGGLVALAAQADPRALLEHWLGFMQHESCGRCVPCRVGSRRALELVRRGPLWSERAQLLRLLELMEQASLCGFGQLMPVPIRQLVQRFATRIFTGTPPECTAEDAVAGQAGGRLAERPPG
ncbi:MAG: hypothetical protein KatS3mg102_2633 [Planctomycetota bacterium]|nr:MAG: hypothetical protein KatS3mg102_2633 [Planctomycetota bacterium]